jgi:hypothetical protein
VGAPKATCGTEKEPRKRKAHAPIAAIFFMAKKTFRITFKL